MLEILRFFLLDRIQPLSRPKLPMNLALRTPLRRRMNKMVDEGS